jgi:Tol biopolymer transport system component
MPLSPGKSLSHYEIIEQAGAGGMGEVFKARDNRLDRTVAIKVLPPSVAANPDLKLRFQREARTISSLNHPNICTLYDVGSEDGLDYIVMEYIEGETLSERIKRGPIPVDELLVIAGQIADALDKAHGQNLIHRDLKPANVMLTSSGAKLLDFGLAKIQITDGHVAGITAITQTTPLTGTGAILGTLHYMAPEQLEGKEADARSDIFSFGALLYEMATGKRAFDGGSQAGLIAGILEREPVSVAAVNPMTPPALERLIKKCLKKDPESRWQSVRDLADELRWISQSGSQVGLPAVLSARRRFRFRLAWVTAAVCGLVAVVFASLWFTRPIPDAPVSRFIVKTQTDLSEVVWPRISPDGKNVAFLATDADAKRMIWIRPLNSLEAYPLAGTEGAGRPFWSPDSKHLAYIAGRSQLKKIPAAGGPAQLICETNGGADGTWGSGDVIIYDGSTGDSLRMVSAAGGSPVAVTRIDRENGEEMHAWPWFLPDGRHFLYLADLVDSIKLGATYMLKVGSVDSDETTSLFPVDARVEYCSQGYLVYFKDNILLAREFDPESLEILGEGVPLTDHVGVGEADRAEFGVSNQGTLTYQTNTVEAFDRLVWLDRQGDEIGQVGEPGGYEDVDISPDGSKFAVSLWDGKQQDIWVYDIARDVFTRLTFDDSPDISPRWSVDSKYVYFSNNQGGVFNIYRKAANGVGESLLIHGNDSLHSAATSISSDGEWLYGPLVRADWNIFRLNLRDSSKVETLVATPFTERAAKVSPDGKYLSYYSNESGRNEVYVLELQEGGGRWQVSSNGGSFPEWSEDGRELYYFGPNWEFTAVAVTLGDAFEIGKPETLFSARLNTGGFGRARYAVSSDRNRFLMNLPMERTGGGEFVVVLNWYKEVQPD